MTQNNIPAVSLPSTLSSPVIEIAGFRLRYFDPTSPISHERPGAEHFDDRSDFILLNRIKGVAVLIDVRRRRTDPSGRKPTRRAGIEVQLLDTESGGVLWADTRYVTLAKDESATTLRVDIPMSYSRINPLRDLVVRVSPASGWDREQCGLDRPLRFFRPDSAPILPTRWFLPEKAWIENPSANDGVRYRHPSPDFHSPLTLRFRVNAASDWVLGRLCELEVRLHLPDGSVVTDIVRPSQALELNPEYDIQPELLDAIASFRLPEDISGPGYAELCCMGYPFAGFLFRFGGSAETGTADELEVIRNYTPERGETRLNGEPDFNLDSAIDRFILDCLREKDEEDEEEEEDETSDEFSDNHSEEPLDGSPQEPLDEPQNESLCEEIPLESPGEPCGKTGMEMLDSLTGLSSVKEKIRRYSEFNRFQQLRRRAGLPVVSLPLHALFLGSPGTGKTTVAKIMGQLMKEAGVLSSGHVVVRERAVLLGQNYNSESEKTLEAIREARGGILFIDEAYQLFQPQDPRDPGRFVLETLMTALADESDRDWMLILAGYPGPLMNMLDLNPGLRSRIPASNFYTFEDYTPVELLEIAGNYLSENGFTLTPAASLRLMATIGADHPSASGSGADNSGSASFGNARYVMNMIQTQILPSAASRVMSSIGSAGELPDPALLSEILPEDIPAPSPRADACRRPLGFRA